ncbi:MULTISPECIES: hypothetical protein [Pseudomonadati]|uniref:hypothetical protein n=1 Tax=Pseudomonadati TaxID=3379134 RepID=UPI0025A651E6|nr:MULTISPECIES: hypothetical protein [Bacteria]
MKAFGLFYAIYDYNANQSIAVIKSSGIGVTISQEQNMALGAIRKELKKSFGDK